MLATVETEDYIWAPTEKQATFMACDAYELLYGGAAGGGKSDAMLIDALGLEQDALAWSRYKAILFRKTYPELEEIIDRSREIYPQVYPGALFNVQAKEWRFPSGAKVILGFMDNDHDRFKHQGPSYQWVGWDQLEHWSTDICYTYMMSRVRSTNPNIKCYVRSTCNPGGTGHYWIRRRFKIDNIGSPTDFIVERKIGKKTVKSRRAFIPAKLDDNPYLSDSGYRERLEMLPEAERKKLLEGRWDVLDGKFFTEINPETLYIEPFEIPPHWPHWRALDWGYSKPFSIGWYTMDPDGNIYRYKEWYGCADDDHMNTGIKMDAGKVGVEILRRDMKDLERGVRFRNNPADIEWTQRGSEKTIADSFNHVRVNGHALNWTPVTKGHGSRVRGWHEVKQRMNHKTVFVFNTCKYFIELMPLQQASETDPDDLRTDGPDHLADEFRYSLVSRHRYMETTRERRKPIIPFTEPWWEYEDSNEMERSKYRL